MKLYIKKELFLKAISATEKNTGKNFTLPILNNVLIKTVENILQLTSTDLELATIAEVPAKIEEEGSIAMNPKTLSGFLVNSPEGEVLLKTKKDILLVEHRNYKTNIKGFLDKDFPLLPKTDKKKFFTIPSTIITSALSQVINSVSISDLKLELTGVFFKITKNNIKLVSTDSFRLSEKTLSRDKSENVNEESFILPTKAANEIIRNYQDLNDILFFYIDKNQVTIQNEENKKVNLRIISKIIEGEYPEYSQIIPKEFTTKVIISKKEFAQQIKSAGLFASRINDITLRVEKDKLTIHSQNNDVGEFSSYIEAHVEGEEQEMRFNYNYLLSGLNNIEGDEVVFKINRSDGPTLVESVKNKDYFYILMPIRK